MNILLNKKSLLLTIGALGAAIMLLFFLASSPMPQKQLKTVPTLVPRVTTAQQQALRVLSIIPDKSVTLEPGKTQSFTTELNKAIDLGSLKIVFTRIDVTKDQPETSIAFSSTISDNGKILVITPQLPIEPYSQYNLLLTNTNNTIIFKTSFLSDKPSISPVQNNNLDLVPYLPYETAWYKLSYLSSKNIYVFNFKYDSESKETLQAQYERAKADAILFIRSKGIGESTIVIEWRYS